MLTKVRSLVLQGNSSENEVAISNEEFYSGIALVCGALIAFGLLFRIL
jgi:hypothetical protein